MPIGEPWSPVSVKKSVKNSFLHFAEPFEVSELRRISSCPGNPQRADDLPSASAASALSRSLNLCSMPEDRDAEAAFERVLTPREKDADEDCQEEFSLLGDAKEEEHLRWADMNSEDERAFRRMAPKEPRDWATVVRVRNSLRKPPQHPKSPPGGNAEYIYSEEPWTEVRKRNSKGEGKSGMMKKNKKKDKAPAKFLCTFYVGISDDPKFTVAKRLIGPQGRNMKYIAEEAPGSKIRLRGKGSMFKERDTGFESKEPLQINISVTYQAGYEKAKQLVTELLESIYADFLKFSGKKVELDLYEDPRNPK